MTTTEIKEQIKKAEKVAKNEGLNPKVREIAQNKLEELKKLLKENSGSSATKKRNGRNLKKRSTKTRNLIKSGKKVKNKSSVKSKKSKKNPKEKLRTPPAWLMFIRKFVTYYANKSCKVETLSKYVESLQDKFQANPKRAKTPHIDILKKIQKILVEAVNSSGRKEKVKVSVSSEILSEMKDVIKNYTVARGKERVYPKYENQELSGIKKKSKKAKK